LPKSKFEMARRKSKGDRKRKRPGGAIRENLQDNVTAVILDLPIEQSVKRRIRVVQPYAFTFFTFAKARWSGRSLLDVYCDEFGSYPKVRRLNCAKSAPQ